MNILAIDQSILISLNHFFIGKSAAIDQLFKFLGVYLIYALPIILILMWFLVKDDKRRMSLMMAMISVVLAVLVVNKIISAFWFRPRPDMALIGLNEVFFHRPDFSFPSDHAATLFAVTFTLYLFSYKKAANWFLIYALVITLSRVVIGVHYPLDIFGGAAVAFICSLIVSVLRNQLKKYVYKPIVYVLKKVYLA